MRYKIQVDDCLLLADFIVTLLLLKKGTSRQDNEMLLADDCLLKCYFVTFNKLKVLSNKYSSLLVLLIDKAN